MRLELTRRADYAVRAMLALARQRHGLLSGRRIAAQMDIPPHFVTQVMGDLVAAGLIEARTGRSGGYRLAREADSISVLAIVEAVEGDGHRRRCVLRGGACSREGVCDVHHIFAGARDRLLAGLAAASLADAVGGSPPVAGQVSVERVDLSTF